MAHNMSLNNFVENSIQIAVEKAKRFVDIFYLIHLSILHCLYLHCIFKFDIVIITQVFYYDTLQ